MDMIEKMKCPHCGMEITLDELIRTQMGKRMEEEKAKVLEEALKNRDAENEKKISAAVDKATEEQGEQITKLLDQIQRLSEANQKATEEMQKMAQNQFELQQKLQNAQLDAQKEFNAKAQELVAQAKKDAEDANSEKIAALEKKLKDVSTDLGESQHKLEQGSQQLQGEVQELRLEECLRLEFPFDRIAEVEKGKPGADVIQTVVSPSGRVCGTIVWESKNVKGWKNDFIPKLRADMEAVDGDVGILVSSVFGKNMGEFTLQDGVWLIRPANVMPIARLIRDGVVKASDAKIIAERNGTVQEAVFEFVTSPVFRNRIQNIGQQYLALEKDITDTKRYMDRHWEKQRTMLDNLVTNTQSILVDVDAHLLLSDSGKSLLLESPEEELESNDT